MNKKILVVACLVMMTTVFSGCDLLGGDKDGGGIKDLITNSKTEKSSGGDGNYFETMEDLMARGKTMKCTYYQKIDDEMTADGVVYLADGNARVEITANKGTVNEAEMYSIMDQEWAYSWTDHSSTGYKMTLEAAKMDKEMKDSVSEMTNEIEFECKKWKKDNSKFKVPSNINFEDMSEMMKGLGVGENGEGVSVSDEFLCEMCKSAPKPEDVAKCLEAYKCD